MRAPVPVEILRCPATKRPLHAEADRLIAEEGERVYPIVDGVPIVIDESQSIVRISEVTHSAGNRRTQSPGVAGRITQRLTPSSSLNVSAHIQVPEFMRRVRALAEGRPRVLIIGGGRIGEGMRALVEAPDIDVVSTDIYISDVVSIACDGHQLPFRDGAFDGVVIQAVLEHVLEPWTVVAEIHRVTRSQGLVYAETPFMQQVHEGAYDFTRFTELGHRRLFRMYEQIERGVCVGPAAALGWNIRYFARSLPRTNQTLIGVSDRLARVGVAWLKYLDRYLASHRGAGDAAAGVFFLGQRSEVPVDDRAMLASYCGTIGSVRVKRGLSER